MIARLERQKEEGLITEGYFICITNESKFWDSKYKHYKNRETCDQQFKMFDGIQKGIKDWRAGTGNGTKGKSRENPIEIKNDYTKSEIEFKEYSDVSNLGASKNSVFKYQFVTPVCNILTTFPSI